MRRVRASFGAAVLAAIAACGGGSGTVQPLPVCTLAAAQNVSLPVGQYVTIDPGSNNGCVGFPANASTTDSAEYLLMPWSAAPAPDESTTFILAVPSARPATNVVAAARQAPLTRRSIAQEFDNFRRNAARTGNYGIPASRAAVAPSAARSAIPQPGLCSPLTVGMQCQFIVCGNTMCTSRLTDTATLRVLGQKVAIFVDQNAPTGGLNDFDLDTLRQVLDTKLFALDTANFGVPSDIDGNGVVMVLMTPIVNQLVTAAECNSVGFILGFFFGADLDPRFRFMFNNGEVYYSLVADPNGDFSCPHDRASIKRLSPRTFVHELQHMINFSYHVVGKPVGSLSEEGWLDEGLSTYAEELAGKSFLPDTQVFRRFTAFGDFLDAWLYLSSPETNALEIPQDNGSAGEIGASWLFVRYLSDQYGAGLAKKLTQATLYGSANVTAQTGVDFTTLVNRWAMANYLNDYPGFPTPPELRYTSWGFRSVFDTLQQSVRATFADSEDFTPPYPLIPLAYPGKALNVSGTLRSGTGFYFRALQGPGDVAFALQFSAGGYLPLPTKQNIRLNIVRMR